MKYLSIVALLFILGLNACYTGIPLRYEKADNNQSYDIQYLFEHDGCKVYRFYDEGNNVYFTNCKGDVTSIENDSTSTRIQNHIKIKEVLD